MEQMDQIVLLILLTLVAAGVGTLSGFGTLTIMVPVLTLFFPLPVALLFVGLERDHGPWACVHPKPAE